jgi:hypothetical protein
MKTEAQTSAARIQMPACARIAVPAKLLGTIAQEMCYQPRTKLYCNPCADCVASPGLPRRGSSSSVVIVGSCSGMPVADAMVLKYAVLGAGELEGQEVVRSMLGWR